MTYFPPQRLHINVGTQRVIITATLVHVAFWQDFHLMGKGYVRKMLEFNLFLIAEIFPSEQQIYATFFFDSPSKEIYFSFCYIEGENYNVL